MDQVLRDFDFDRDVFFDSSLPNAKRRIERIWKARRQVIESSKKHIEDELIAAQEAHKDACGRAFRDVTQPKIKGLSPKDWKQACERYYLLKVGFNSYIGI